MLAPVAVFIGILKCCVHVYIGLLKESKGYFSFMVLCLPVSSVSVAIPVAVPEKTLSSFSITACLAISYQLRALRCAECAGARYTLVRMLTAVVGLLPRR